MAVIVPNGLFWVAIGPYTLTHPPQQQHRTCLPPANDLHCLWDHTL